METISKLVLAIRQQPHSDKDYEARVAAIKRAAEIQNPDSQIVEALLDNISCYAKRVPLNPMSAPKFGFLPAHDALVTIGKPVIIPALLEKLKAVDDGNLRVQYAFLLQEIVGKTRSSELLKKDIETAKLSEQKTRLRKSLELLR